MSSLLLLALLARAGDPPPAPDAVAFPAGSFAMGSDRQADEQPIHTETTGAFALDRREVRLGEYRRFAAGGAGAGPDHPVVGVTWEEARAWCAARGGRLPTEAEWERACAGSSGGPYPWGAGDDRPATWWEESEHGKYGYLWGIETAATADPATLTPEGVEDMAGNVWEWTETPYHRDAYRGADPTGSPWVVIRGGSYANLRSYATCTHREPARPDEVRLTLGFRCAYPVSSP